MKRSCLTLGLTLLMLALLPKALAETDTSMAEHTSLAAWNGDWVSAYTFVDEPAMQAVYDAIADAAGAPSEEARAAVETMFESSFSRLEVIDDTITFTRRSRRIHHAGCPAWSRSPRACSRVALNILIGLVITGSFVEGFLIARAIVDIFGGLPWESVGRCGWGNVVR